MENCCLFFFYEKDSRQRIEMEKQMDQVENKVKVKSLSRVRLFAIPWNVAYQAPLSMRFSRQ